MPKPLLNRSGNAAGGAVRVNVRTTVNHASIRRERRNGRDYIIVPSATMPDNIVMNRVRYPADEIEKGYASLENTPAPLGHPDIEGQFVSAKDPEGLARGWIGAWNKNVRRENGRVFIDKVIDVATAMQLEGGKAVLNAIEKGEPIHTSTGLYAIMTATTNDADADFVASELEFDHDAILLGEEGAATPDQGVGMLVNKAVRDGKEIEVINSVIEDDAERELGWAVDSIARALERRERASFIERMKTAIVELFGSERATSTNEKENDMAVSDEQFKALSDEVKTLSDSMKDIGKTIGEAVANAVKPLVDAQAEMAANQKAKDEAETAELVAKVVKANILDEETAKATPLNTLRKLAPKAEPGKAAALNGALGGDTKTSGFKLPGADKKEG